MPQLYLLTWISVPLVTHALFCPWRLESPFSKFIFFSSLYTHCEAQTHHSEIKSLTLFQQSQPGAPYVWKC